MKSLIAYLKQVDHAFKPTAYQEAILQAIAKRRKPQLLRNWYKKQVTDEFTCGALMEMKEGETFALCSPDGVRVFKMVEFRPNGEKNIKVKENRSQTIIDDFFAHENSTPIPAFPQIQERDLGEGEGA